ncbi:MAG: aldo/keto reductase [Trueperaceae bacterium]|nr:aldo/keto reductase [Trueperaceae bacterium]
MEAPKVTLIDGREMPVIGLGTWPLDDEAAERVVSDAISAGYRHIDTAVRYGNETGVGRGLASSGLPRDALFVTTKLDGEFQGSERAEAGLRASLDRLGLESVDLLLIHWPLPQRDLYVSTWRTFERLQGLGLARSIGVSNFKPAHLERLAVETSVIPAVNQVQLNPRVARLDHRDYHERHGIVTVSYTPLGRGPELLAEGAIQTVAARHGKSPAQVVLRWHLQHGLVPIPKSADPGRLRENLAVFDFQLDAAEMAAIDAVDTGGGVDSDERGH